MMPARTLRTAAIPVITPANVIHPSPWYSPYSSTSERVELVRMPYVAISFHLPVRFTADAAGRQPKRSGLRPRGHRPVGMIGRAVRLRQRGDVLEQPGLARVLDRLAPGGHIDLPVDRDRLRLDRVP